MSDINTQEALELAQQLLAGQTREAEIEAQQKRLSEERAALSARLADLRVKFSRLIVNGTTKAGPVKPASPAVKPASPTQTPQVNDDEEGDEDGDGEEGDDEGEGEEANESQRAQVLAFYASQPGKRIPLLYAIANLPDVPEVRVRDYSSKFARPGGPLKRVTRGVYKYVGKTEE